MNRKLFRAAIVLLWLAPVAIALAYAAVWDQLPASMATHFNAAGRANGWMSREASLTLTLGILAPLLGLITWILSRVREPRVDFWSLLGLFYVIGGMMYAVNQQLIAYNLRGEPIHPGPVVAPVFVAIIVVVVAFLGSARGVPLPQAAVLAEETHAVRLWALLFVVPLAGQVAALIAVPDAGVRVALLLACVLFGGLFAFVWSGFQYRFTSAGVEIRTLGFRLRSIPAGEIKSYSAQAWAPLCGYGIRGLGNRRAYVWGSRGVRIETTTGQEIFLGHAEPERIVRDLEMLRPGR
jgi:hypothetical protein